MGDAKKCRFWIWGGGGWNTGRTGAVGDADYGTFLLWRLIVAEHGGRGYEECEECN